MSGGALGAAGGGWREAGEWREGKERGGWKWEALGGAGTKRWGKGGAGTEGVGEGKGCHRPQAGERVRRR